MTSQSALCLAARRRPISGREGVWPGDGKQQKPSLPCEMKRRVKDNRRWGMGAAAYADYKRLGALCTMVLFNILPLLPRDR